MNDHNKATPSSIEIMDQPDELQGGEVLHPDTPVRKTRVGARLDEAIELIKPINRSTNLVPLIREYTVMKKELRALLAATKTFKASTLAMDHARTKMVTQMATMASTTPIYDPVGDAIIGDSFASTVDAASKVTFTMDSVFQGRIVDYCSEWERVVTSRVDGGIRETRKLRKQLTHYEKKVKGLRRRVNRKEEAGKEVATKLKEKLARHETKLKSTWKSHERSASVLGSLLEQVTEKGWKDLAPLVRNIIQWEFEHATSTFVAFSRLPAISETLLATVEKAMVPYADEENTVAVVLADDELETESETGSSVTSELETYLSA